MEENLEGQEPQKSPEEPTEDVATLKAQLEEAQKRADVSSQNFERAKKAENEVKELKTKLELKEKGEVPSLDPNQLKQEIDDKVDLRLAGIESEHIAEIERYAKGAGISLAEAAKSPFIKGAVDALMAKKKSTDTSPAPSNKIRTFKGKPIEKIYQEGSAAEKQAAWEAELRGGVKTNE